MELLTSRLILKKYVTLDLDAFCEVICNDDVMYHISGKGNPRAVAKEKFEGIVKTNQENDLYGVYKVILKKTDAVVGFAKITPFEEDCLEIGYALLVPFWRKGYTIEMIEKMTNHCLEYFSNKRIIAIVNKGNIGSVKVLEKCDYSVYKEEEFKGSPCLFFEYSE